MRIVPRHGTDRAVVVTGPFEANGQVRQLLFGNGVDSREQMRKGTDPFPGWPGRAAGGWVAQRQDVFSLRLRSVVDLDIVVRINQLDSKENL